MAAPLSSLLLIAFAAVALVVSPVIAQDCRSQRLPSNALYTNCSNLPTLDATLHWNYSTTTNPPRLSVAFTAPPPSEDGWVSWAINPTAPAMVGSQAFIAFRDSNNGSIVVRTYDIQSKGPVTESRISYEVLSKSAVLSDGTITIFAVVSLPGSGPVYQVWQVGRLVVDGVPRAHDFGPENLNAVGPLPVTRILTPTAPSPAPVPRRSPTSAPAPGNPAATPPPPRNAGYSVIKMGGWFSLALCLCSSLLF